MTKNATPDEQEDMQMPQPAPELKKLSRLIGTWNMKGHLLGSDEENITGQMTFSWLPGEFFLLQSGSLSFMGMPIENHELIGYDEESKSFTSLVYSNMSPMPLPYKWDIDGDTLRISVSYGPMDASFEGKFSEDGNSFAGGWRPNPGADQNINVAYDISGDRIK